jgi:hypothetical protein
MAYIGKTPTPAPLTSSDIAADIINNTHIGDTAISGFDALATAPADTDEFLISDGGVLKRLDASLIGGGSWNLLQTATASSSSTVDITTGMDSTYQNYAVIYSNVHPATDDVLLQIRVSTDGGSSFDSSSNYRYSSHCLRDNGSEGLTVNTGNDKLYVSGITFGNANNECGNGIVYIGNPSSSTFSTSFNILASNMDNSGRSSTCNTGGVWTTTTAVNGIQFFFSSGNVDAGVFKLYGIS